MQGEATAAKLPGYWAHADAWLAIRRMGSYVQLLKLKKVAMLVFVSLAAAVVAAGGTLPVAPIALLLIVGSLACAGACALNHYLDRDIDALMARTRRRPLPAHQIGAPAHAAAVGSGLIALALILSLYGLGYLASLFVGLGAFTYVVLYTAWLKRRSKLNIVIGGVAGSCAALAGWSAVNPQLTPTALLLGLLIFLWTPSHFWSLALVHLEDYRRAGVPMLPVIAGPQRTARAILLNSLVLALVSLAPFVLGSFGWLYLSLAAVAGVLFLALGWRLATTPTRSLAWLSYKCSGPYLGSLFLAMLLDLLFK